MKSSNKTYLHGIDQLRAFASMLVLYWHAIHSGYVKTSYVPDNIFMGYFEEGHTGVALFITITGFIFTYIIADKDIIYRKFLYNRFIRIFPLLFIASLFASFYASGVNKGDPLTIIKFFNLFGGGALNGSWTIVIEFQFYLFFPIIYMHFRGKYRGKWLKYFPYILFIVLGMIFRLIYFSKHGNVQEISYWSIFGRIDQFMFGIISALLLTDLKNINKKKYFGISIFLISLSALVIFYYYFNKSGGYYHRPSYPSPNNIWLFIPTMEGLLYGLMIIGWVLFSTEWTNIFSKFLAYLGSISYSTYLLHVPAIGLCHAIISRYEISFSEDKFIDGNLAILILIYPAIMIFSSISYELIEKPFLNKRTKYLVNKI